MKSHGELTAKVGKGLKFDGCDVFYDHGTAGENVGKIVSSIEKKYGKKDGLSQLDIAVVERSSNRVLVLVEVEESTDRPKTMIGDIFGVLFGEYLSFKRRELIVGPFTTLLVTGVGAADYVDRNQHILQKVHKVKALLGTKNSAMDLLPIKVFPSGAKLLAELPGEIGRIVQAAPRSAAA